MKRSKVHHMDLSSPPPSNLWVLFGESSVPGVRDIAVSRSFLRRLFWICSFFFFGFLALRDISQLVSEYYTYPITVDVRLRDSRRLQFPAVTVCNLNIVRYTALCNGNHSVIKDSMIPRDLKEKLCGIASTSAQSATQATPATVMPTATTTSGATKTTAPMTQTTKETMIVTTSTTKKHVFTTGSNKNKANTQREQSHRSTTTMTTTTATDNNEGIDDINNYAAISKLKPLNASDACINSTVKCNLWNDTKKADDDNFDGNTTSVTKQMDDHHQDNSKKPFETLTTLIHQITSTPTSVTKSVKRIKRRSKTWSNSTTLPVNGTNNFTVSNGNDNKPSVKSVNNSSTSPQTLDNDIELTEREEKELQENLTNWLAVIYNSNEQITKKLGHQFEDLILRCTIRSTNCTHKNSFERFFTPTEGNCFTFKSQRLRKTYLERIKDETSIAGVNYGLELVLNLEISEYLTGTAQIGAIIMIQHPDETGNSPSEAIFVAPQQSTYIGLKMVNISRLPKPYPEDCIDHWPSALVGRLTQNASYSQQACLKICLQRTIHTRCNCQSAMLPQLDLNSTLIICDTRRRRTRNCVEEVMFQAEEKVSTCKCPPRCQVINYDKTVSMTKWPTREDKVTFDRGKANLNFQNLAKVTVYFQTMTCQEVRQEKAYTTAKLFSSLGGILGMYVGFSFLSLFEILEVFIRRFWYMLTKKKSRFRAAVRAVTAAFAFNSKRAAINPKQDNSPQNDDQETGVPQYNAPPRTTTKRYVNSFNVPYRPRLI